MKLSIIVPIYNAEKYLCRCLDSLKLISYTNMEILCINDGSTDSSEEICKSYVMQDKRFRVIKQKNSGLPVARNRGLKEARGEYISFVDSDDWIDSKMLPDFVEKMDDDLSIDFCVSDAVRSYPDGSEERMFQPESEQMLIREEALREMLLNRIFFWYMWGKVYRREVFEGFHADESISTSEDLDSNWKLFENKKIEKVWYSPQYRYYYFMNPESMTEGISILKRRQSDLKVYLKTLDTKMNIHSNDIFYQMKLYSLHAIYDILREICFFNIQKDCIDKYVLLGREIIESMGEVKQVDVGYVNRMRNLTVNVKETQRYFLDVFQNVEKVLASIGATHNIYIYGTGIVARYIEAMLRRFRDYDGHVISDGKPNIQYFKEKPVFYLSQIPKRSILILAMNRTNQKQVLHNLKGRVNVITLPIPDEF